MGKRSQQRHTRLTLERRIQQSKTRKAREEQERKKAQEAAIEALLRGITRIPEGRPSARN